MPGSNNKPGLSYEQGPRLAAPMRLFLLAPVFLMLSAGAGIVLVDDWMLGRWTSASLALTHLLTLGVLGAVMQGALLQMLPVVLGSPMPQSSALSWCGLFGLGFGAPLLAGGLWLGDTDLLTVAMALLGLAWLPFLTGLTYSLMRAQTAGAMDWPLRLATLSLLLTVASGLDLAGGLAGMSMLDPMGDFFDRVNLHAAWGLIGWVAVLIIGVAYQVVPMLQLTPGYPDWLTRLLAWWLPAALLAFSLGLLVEDAAWLSAWASRALAAGLLLFAVWTLHLFRHRRRRLPDVSLHFWRLGLLALCLAVLLYGSLDYIPEVERGRVQVSIGLLFLLGFALSITVGMLYKIIPFLSWFHLQSQTGARAGSLPSMRDMITEPAMRVHFRLHVGAFCLLAPAPWLPDWLVTVGLFALAAGGQRLWLNLRMARAAFLAHGGKM